MSTLQERITAKGQEIFARMEGETAGVFSHRGFVGRLMDWSMGNEALKTQLFRFVDVLPSLDSSREVARHAYEYLAENQQGLPMLARWGVRLSPRIPWLTAWAAQRGVETMARTFILARDATEAVRLLTRMRERPLAFTVDILGETAVSEKEAGQYQARYLELIERLSAEAARWPGVAQIDNDDRGEIPRVNVSVKISALNSQIKPADPEGAIEVLGNRLRPLLLRAQELGAFINFDMESTALKDLTLELFKRLLDEPALRGYRHAGLALQAYLRSSEQDLANLILWARERDRSITIRLIKGAYWDTETVLARQRGWPVPVFEQKAETDANYEKLAGVMLDNRKWINPAFGTHSVRSMASCLVQAEERGLSSQALEIQMLHGMAEPMKAALLKMGCRVRDYCPVGEILPGMSYLVRRLLENTSNEGFLRATFTRTASRLALLRDPTEPAPTEPPTPAASGVAGGLPATGSTEVSGFANEPLTDFTDASKRQAMASALRLVKTKLGGRYPVLISGQGRWPADLIVSVNPARPDEIVGRVAKAGTAEADAAIAAARSARKRWSRTSVSERAALLDRAAGLLREERFEFAALETLETGKTWIESDADVAEAIDFCRFYAAEMRRLAGARHGVPGETSLHHYVARGTAAVIAPWNFPLAILCGMTVAALVTGNCVIMKPSEQSSVVAAWFMNILRRAGVPQDVLHFLPGRGSDVGAYLVDHPEVDVIAFTGSREVGLKIHEAAGRTRPGQLHLKHAICELGGKNAIIVDGDADLDEAVLGIVSSAFGYQGQKCSALSRLVVLPENYDRLVDRVIEATRSLKVGSPEDPGTVIGPVIDQDSFDRIRAYIEYGKREGRLVFQGAVPDGGGFFIGPTVFADVRPEARIAQEEIFGPVLAILRARNLDEALSIANGTPYALTGGLYSRSPANIARVSAEMEAGNIYINRPITGALVGRHPFGGFKMSGGGSKAGGRDYLQHFLFSRVVTENRMRRGFAPETEETS